MDATKLAVIASVAARAPAAPAIGSAPLLEPEPPDDDDEFDEFDAANAIAIVMLPHAMRVSVGASWMTTERFMMEYSPLKRTASRPSARGRSSPHTHNAYGSAP
jgi:hypothetical protein